MDDLTRQRITAQLDACQLSTDEMLAEFIGILLKNGKSRGEFTQELTALLGAEVAPAIDQFVGWLFTESGLLVSEEKPLVPAEVVTPVKDSTPWEDVDVEDNTMDIILDDAPSPEAAVLPASTDTLLPSSAPHFKTNQPTKEPAPPSQPPSFMVTLGAEGEQTIRASDTGASLVNPIDALADKKLIRCLFWPSCSKGEACAYTHPSQLCRNFPQCSYGDKCLNIHPVTPRIPCRFGDACTKASCSFSHDSFGPVRAYQSKKFTARSAPYSSASSAPSSTNIPSAVECKFGETCVRLHCPYRHPLSRPLPAAPASRSLAHNVSAVLCRFDPRCSRANCPYFHKSSHRSGTDHISDRPFVGDAAASVSIEASHDAIMDAAMEASY